MVRLFIVDVQFVVRVPVGVTLVPTARDAAVADPAPAIVPVTLALVTSGNVIAAVTVNRIPELTLTVDPLPIVIELHVLLPSTVRVNPAPMTISSVAAGIVPPGHGAPATVELQLPVPVVVIVAAIAVAPSATISTNIVSKTIKLGNM
jgi:hypothetical protein